MPVRPNQPSAFPDFDGLGHAGFTDGNPGTGLEATIPTARDANHWSEDPCRLVEGAGLTLDENSYDQTLQATKILAAKAQLSPTKNLLLNAAFDVWQRLTSAPPSFALSTAAYTADRWRCDPGTSGVATISRATPTVGSSPELAGGPYALQWAQTTGGTSPRLEQRLEGVEQFDAQTLMLSIWAKVASGSITGILKVRQDFGVGGSSPVETAGTSFTITTTEARKSVAIAVPSIAGKTIGTNPYTSFILQLPDATTFTLTVKCAQMEPGAFATDFVRVDPSVEMPKLFRYCWKSYERETPLGTVTTVGALTADDAGNVIDGLDVMFPVEMRAPPSLTWYSTRTGLVGKVERPPGADAVVTTTNYSSSRQSGAPNTGAVATGNTLGHLLAEAEL